MSDLYKPDPLNPAANTSEEKFRISLDPEHEPVPAEGELIARTPDAALTESDEPILITRTSRLAGDDTADEEASAAPQAISPNPYPAAHAQQPPVAEQTAPAAAARLEPLRPAAAPAARSEEEAEPHKPQRILVLGATSGIAQACIRRWATRGDHLFLVARNRDRLAAVTADAAIRGALRAEQAVADLDDVTVHNDVLAHAINSLGGLDLAFIAVGTLGDQAAGERSFDVAAASLYTNFVAPVSVLTWLANYCTQRRSGTLAVLSSVAGERGRKSNYIYGSAKAGLSAFLSGLRNRIDREGVRVVTIKPGPVRTAMTLGMKGSEKFADVDDVADTIVRSLDGPADILYVPGKWRLIMAVIRAIPERMFKKTNL